MATTNSTERRLKDLRRAIVEARGVMMSASCMVNRAETLAAVDAILANFEEDINEAVNKATAEAGRRRWDALDQTDIVQEAKMRAVQIEAKARAEQEELLAEADRYVETRLASFEAELQVTLSRVSAMRDRLISRASKELEAEQTTIMPKWTL